MTPMYAHARRRHVFCDECIRHAIVEKPACPTCRAPVAVEELAPDRLAGALVENLPARCHFSASGCSWMGKHGELQSHLATSCPCVLLTCPSCEMEVERGKMWAHSRQCGSSGECPYGCGERFADADRLAEHRAVCLMEPRKLMAALGLLQRENERLSSENLALRADRSAVEVRCAPSHVARCLLTDFFSGRRVRGAPAFATCW